MIKVTQFQKISVLSFLCFGFLGFAMGSEKQLYEKRISELRKSFAHEGIDAFVVPHNDEFQCEEVPDANQRLRYITGFTGSAGTVVIADDFAVIFVDGRYTLHAKAQVPTPLTVVTENVSAGDTWITWVQSNLKDKVLGYDSKLFLHKDYDSNAFEGLKLKETSCNLVDKLWDGESRPQLTLNPIELYESFAGVPSKQKIAQVLKVLEDCSIDAAILSDLDSIAWLLNIRGRDLRYTPIVLASAIVHTAGTIDLITTTRTSYPESHFSQLKVVLYPPEKFADLIAQLADKKVLVDKDKVTMWIVNRLEQIKASIVFDTDPSWAYRAQKNPTEIESMKLAHICDGVGLCRFLNWFDREASNGDLTEKQAAEKLWYFRKDTAEFFKPFKGFTLEMESFPTISAYGPHAAMPHYSVDEIQEGSDLIGKDSLFLVDSGAQYPNGGTTDITRTVAVDKADNRHKEMFTRVLKGHIALADIKFPPRTPGRKLDSLPRQFLWEIGKDYGHGTSHGVGSYLGVHESPGSNMGSFLVHLQAGMILSNEPGYYEEGDYGIRIENVILVKNSHMDGYLEFETISLAPIDQRLILVEMLTDKELSWLNGYHKEVFKQLSPHVNSALDLNFLKETTNAINREYHQSLQILKHKSESKPKVMQKPQLEALQLLRKAAEDGHGPARNELSTLLLFGYGYGLCLPDYESNSAEYRKEAFHWAKQMIDDTPTPEDHDNLAMMYENGWGTEVNYIKAFQHTLKAADPAGDGTGKFGWPDAQFRLAWIYEVIEKDIVKAQKWLEIANENEQTQQPLGLTIDRYEELFKNAVNTYQSSAAAIYLAGFYQMKRLLSKKQGHSDSIKYYKKAQELGENGDCRMLTRLKVS